MTDKQNNALQNITHLLNIFLEPFECTANLDTDFAYYSASNLITYTFVVADKHEKTFTDFTRTLFPQIEANIFLWSFLHELGHHETEDDFEDNEWEEYLNKIDFIKNDYEYYNLPIEYAATYWAGKYMINHKDEIKNLWDQLMPLIQSFYKEMEIDNYEA